VTARVELRLALALPVARAPAERQRLAGRRALECAPGVAFAEGAFDGALVLAQAEHALVGEPGARPGRGLRCGRSRKGAGDETAEYETHGARSWQRLGSRGSRLGHGAGTGGSGGALGSRVRGETGLRLAHFALRRAPSAADDARAVERLAARRPSREVPCRTVHRAIRSASAGASPRSWPPRSPRARARASTTSCFASTSCRPTRTGASSTSRAGARSPTTTSTPSSAP